MEKQITWLQANCPHFKSWRRQTSYNFDFVTLDGVLLPKVSIVNSSPLKCPISQHFEAKYWGCINLVGAKIPVQSELNINAWQEALVGQAVYRTMKVWLLLSTDYVPLSVTPKPLISNTNDIAYLQEYRNHKTIIGPFHTDPIPNMHPPTMTRANQYQITRRVIIDLSWPHGNSVNIPHC